MAHGSIQFMAYEELKRRVSAKYNNNRPLTTAEYLGCAALSKVFAASITYPYQVVRARLQDQYKDWGTIRVIIRNTIKYEGFRGFYKGLVPYLLHVMPNICIVFITYELLVNKMNDPSAGSALPSPSSSPPTAASPPPLLAAPSAASASHAASTFSNNSFTPLSSTSSTTTTTRSRTPTTKDIPFFQTPFPAEQPEKRKNSAVIIGVAHRTDVVPGGTSVSNKRVERELSAETPALLFEEDIGS